MKRFKFIGREREYSGMVDIDFRIGVLIIKEIYMMILSDNVWAELTDFRWSYFVMVAILVGINH